MRVIFLDIDGVLITEQSMRESGRFDVADSQCVEQLNRITDSTGAEIVISSSWRLIHGLNDTRDFLRRWGVIGSIESMTPDISVSTGGIAVTRTRGDEIEAWLARFPQNRHAMPFVILDDDDDMGSLSSHLIRSDFHSGLTAELADRAIALLGM